jgi:hypothetical protein
LLYCLLSFSACSISFFDAQSRLAAARGAQNELFASFNTGEDV